MICDPCKQAADHRQLHTFCKGDCPCQHRHAGAWRGVKETLVQAALRAVGANPYDYQGRKETK